MTDLPRIDQLLATVLQRGASDLHLKAGNPPVLRLDGTLHRLQFPSLTESDAELYLGEILPDRLQVEFKEHSEADLTRGLPAGERFRVNAFRQRGETVVAMRALRAPDGDLDGLGLPSVVGRAAGGGLHCVSSPYHPRMLPPRLERLLGADGVPMRVAAAFADAGFDLYLVGGSVRDALLERTPELEDHDFTTPARPDQIEQVLSGVAHSVVTIGKEFGTIGGIIDDVVVEVTTFRSEIYRDDSRKPIVEFSDDLREDLSRRDFAVNAMAIRLHPEPEMIDPHGGLADLAAGVLRTPLDPEVSFGDDPLRMLRLYRFASTLGFTPDPAAIAAVEEMSNRLEIVSGERIRDELDRLLMGDHVETALAALVESGLAAVFMPELPALALEQDPVQRHKDVLSHTIAVVAKCPADRITRLGALFHDIGKPATRAFGPGGVSFHHHEVVGARMTRARMRELRYSKDDIADASQLVYLHMRHHTFKMGWTDRAVRRYVRDAGALLERLNNLIRCDVTTRNEKKARQIQNRIDELEDRIAALREREELDAIRPPIDGNRVMEILGIPPGPQVGEVMDMLLEHRLDEGPYSEEEAERLVTEWAEQRENG